MVPGLLKLASDDSKKRDSLKGKTLDIVAPNGKKITVENWERDEPPTDFEIDEWSGANNQKAMPMAPVKASPSSAQFNKKPVSTAMRGPSYGIGEAIKSSKRSKETRDPNALPNAQKKEMTEGGIGKPDTYKQTREKTNKAIEGTAKKLKEVQNAIPKFLQGPLAQAFPNIVPDAAAQVIHTPQNVLSEGKTIMSDAPLKEKLGAAANIALVVVPIEEILGKGSAKILGAAIERTGAGKFVVNSIERLMKGGVDPEKIIKALGDTPKVRATVESVINEPVGAGFRPKTPPIQAGPHAPQPKEIYHASRREGSPTVRVGGQRMLGEPDGLYYSETPEGATRSAAIQPDEKAHITASSPPKNPLVVPEGGLDSEAFKIAKEIWAREGIGTPRDIEHATSIPGVQKEISAELTRRLKRQGYDGVKFSSPHSDTYYVKFEADAPKVEPVKTPKPGEQSNTGVTPLKAGTKGTYTMPDGRTLRHPGSLENEDGTLDFVDILHQDDKTATVLFEDGTMKEVPSVKVTENYPNGYRGERPAGIKNSGNDYRPKAEEPAKPPVQEPQTTGLANQALEREGITPEKGKTVTKGESQAYGEEVLSKASDPISSAEKLAKEVADGNRPFTWGEHGVLLAGKRRLMNAVNDAKEVLDNAAPHMKEAALEAYEAARTRLQTFVDNVQKGKTEWSNTGKALQEGVELDTGNFAEVISEAERYGKVSPKLEAHLKSLTDQIKTLDAQVAKLEKSATENAVKKAKQIAKRKSKEQLDEELNGILKSLNEAAAKAGAGVSPDVLKAYGKLAFHAVERGYSKVEDIVNFVLKHIPDADPKDIEDALHAELAAQQSAATPYGKKLNTSEALAAKGAANYEQQLTTGPLVGTTPRNPLVVTPEIKALRAKRDSLRNQVKARILANKPKTIPAKLQNFGRNVQLANPVSRIVDLAANTTKLLSYVGLNPARSLLNDVAFKNTVGREGLITWSKARNVFEGAKDRWKKELVDIAKGADTETVEKFGGSSGPFTKLAGMTDVVFKDIYTRLALDDYAASYARKFPKDQQKAAREAIWRQLVDDAPGPLSSIDKETAHAIAKDWALRQTLNVDNVASRITTGIKENPAKYLDKEHGKFAGDSWRAATDAIFRFSKVIGNVALDKANYTAAGPAEAAVRTISAKIAGGGLGAKIPAKDARLIADLAVKGLVGAATFKAGEAMLPWLKDQEWIKPEIVTLKGGTKFVKWTLLPNVLGGLDANQLGGLTSPLLFGATHRYIEESSLTRKQKDALWKRYQLEQAVNQPLTSNASDVLSVVKGEKGLDQYAGSVVSRQVIPGGVSEVARRMDNDKIRKSKTFWDGFTSRLPGDWQLGPIGGRESLPLNQK